MTKLEELRAAIDGIDDQIIRLYVARMELSKEIAIEKNKSKLPVENTQRERKIVGRITEQVPEDMLIYAEQLYNTIFETSKAYQSLFCDKL